MFPWSFSPFNKDTMNKLKQMRPEEVENFVYDMMGRMFPPEMQGMNMAKGFASTFNSSSTEEGRNKLDPKVFETLDFVYVLIPFHDQEQLQAIKIYHTSNQLIIENIPSREDKQTIVLPAVVKKKGAKASYKDGILEIRLLKNIDIQFSEIDIMEKY